jgi:hypothetical protein
LFWFHVSSQSITAGGTGSCCPVAATLLDGTSWYTEYQMSAAAAAAAAAQTGLAISLTRQSYVGDVY